MKIRTHFNKIKESIRKKTQKAASDMVVTLMLTVIVIALCSAFNSWINTATQSVYTKADSDIQTILSSSGH